MKSIATFLFGSGWGTLWYAAHYLLLLPIWGFYGYFRDFKPGAGPQGGEAIFLFLIMYAVVVVGFGVVNAVVVMAASDLAWWARYLLVPLVLFVYPIVAMFLGVAAADASTEPEFNGRLRVALTLPLLGLIFYALNFWALSTTRE